MTNTQTITQIQNEDDKELAIERIREIHSELKSQDSLDLENNIKELEVQKAEIEKSIKAKQAELKAIKDAKRDAEKPLKKELSDITKLLGEYEASKAVAA